MSKHSLMRDVRSRDVESIVDIAIAAWDPFFAVYRQTLGEESFAAAFPNWQEEKARQVRTACDPQNGAMACVAEEEGRVVGFIAFYAHRASGMGEIGNNAVHPDFQGMGIGTAMYLHIFRRLTELGMRSVKVTTGGDAAYAPARRAYQTCIPHFLNRV